MYFAKHNNPFRFGMFNYWENPVMTYSAKILRFEYYFPAIHTTAMARNNYVCFFITLDQDV